MGKASTHMKAAILMAVIVVAMIVSSAAYACPTCGCVASNHNRTRSEGVNAAPEFVLDAVFPQHDETRAHISDEFADQTNFLLNNMFKQKLLPAMMMMTEQLTTVAMQQALIVGSFFDAKQQLETQRVLQKLRAEAHRDYRPSVSVCTFGTNIRSLADSERRGEYTNFLLSQRSQDRQMGNIYSAAARGDFDDRRMRVQQFSDVFCRSSDNNRGLDGLCGSNKAPLPPDLYNADVDYGGLVGLQGTLDVDFIAHDELANPVTDDERALFALASNLYSNDIMYRIPETILENEDNRLALIDMRSIIAKRSVIENSFNTIAGLKSQSQPTAGENATNGNGQNTPGPNKVAPYMKSILKTLGVTAGADMQALFDDRPSYDAQMEILTRRLYQRPEFYTNLYDSPANVTRQGVALQAVGLMQDFDTWQSHLRSEAMLSVLLEMELLRIQRDVQSKLDRL